MEPLRPSWRFAIAVALGCAGPFIVKAAPPLHYVPFALPLPIVFLACLYLGGVPSAVCALCSAVLVPLLIYPQHAFSSHHVLRSGAFLVNAFLIGYLAHRYSLRLERERNRARQLLEENEVRTHLALDGANAGIWDWDIVKNVANWSEGHTRLHGYEPGSVIPGYDAWQKALHPEDVTRVESELEEARFTRRPFHSEYRVIWPNGETRWILSQARFSYDAKGNAVRLTGMSGDITHRKKGAIALLQTEKLAAVGRLAATIAHEINNPLEAMTNLLYLAAQDAPEGPVQEWLAQAMKELERVSQIAHQTLRFSRAQGSVTMVRPSMLLESSVALFQRKIIDSRIDVERDYVDDPPFSCLPGDVRQILANLVGNAIDAMPHGGRLVVRVRAASNWRRGSGRGVRISIGDTGTGMSEEVRQRIFEPFFTTKGEVGTGLGLWVMEQLVERHRGFVQVRSNTSPERHGTVVSVFFPFGITPEQVTGASEAA